MVRAINRIIGASIEQRILPDFDYDVRLQYRKEKAPILFEGASPKGKSLPVRQRTGPERGLCVAVQSRAGEAACVRAGTAIRLN